MSDQQLQNWYGKFVPAPDKDAEIARLKAELAEKEKARQQWEDLAMQLQREASK